MNDDKKDILAACYTDIPIRDQRETMERPFFSLAKNPRKSPIEYEVNGVYVKVTPSDSGIATIWDADILIWAATQITEALDRGRGASKVIRFHPHALLKGIRRHTGGDQYKKLIDALRRLHTTTIETNIRPLKGRIKREAFHWIDHWKAEESPDGKPLGMSLTLADWLYEGIVQEGGVLSIHEDYFLLTGGIERWLYRVARKHAGHQETGWQFTMKQLYDKSGSSATFANFAFDVRKVVKKNRLPEYSIELVRNGEGDEIVLMVRRSLLSVTDPRFETPRHPRRRHAGGIRQQAFRFTPDKPSPDA